MSGDTTGKISKAEPSTDWKRLRGMTDDEVHAGVAADPDVKPTDEAFWRKARVIRPKADGKLSEPQKMKTREEQRQDIQNYIEVRKWYRDRVKQGNATDADLKKLEQCRDLAVDARRSGITAPAFD